MNVRPALAPAQVLAALRRAIAVAEQAQAADHHPFGALLLGRWRRGWRGTTAVRWTLTAMALLVLAFFGSKFVLEMVLHRTG